MVVLGDCMLALCDTILVLGDCTVVPIDNMLFRGNALWF